VNMDVSIDIPLDSDGFMRRECPSCKQQFKWHHGPANEEAETQPPAVTYYCPLCGTPAGLDAWWTQAQIDYCQGVAMPQAMRQLQDEIGSQLRSASIKFEPGLLGNQAQPAALTEPDDMVMLASPCHAFEPVKVPEDVPGPFHCLVCGSAFAI
jgi:Zn ribbon nucleic-acid-binding protein